MGVLQQYAGSNASNPPANVQQDFQHVAQNAPQSSLAGGLSNAFNSNQTPAFPQMLSSLFSNSNSDQKSGILSHLIGAAGPSAAGGILGSLGGLLSGGLGQGSTQLTPQQAEQVSPEAVQQLAQHAQQNDPSIVDKASSFYAQHPQVVQALGAGALAMVMSHMSQQR